eukprot:g47255.t1
MELDVSVTSLSTFLQSKSISYAESNGFYTVYWYFGRKYIFTRYTFRTNSRDAALSKLKLKTFTHLSTPPPSQHHSPRTPKSPLLPTPNLTAAPSTKPKLCTDDHPS